MFERSRIYKDDLKVETVIDFQDDDKERFFTELYEWLEKSIDSDVEVRDSFLWEEKASFAYYAADYYELPNGDGWERSDGPVSSIILKRKCPDYDAVAEIKIIPLYEKAKRIGIIKVKDELLTYPEIKSMMKAEKK